MSRILLTQASRHVWSRLTFDVGRTNQEAIASAYAVFCSIGEKQDDVGDEARFVFIRPYLTHGFAAKIQKE
jgi:hypothetical protein